MQFVIFNAYRCWMLNCRFVYRFFISIFFERTPTCAYYHFLSLTKRIFRDVRSDNCHIKRVIIDDEDDDEEESQEISLKMVKMHGLAYHVNFIILFLIVFFAKYIFLVNKVFFLVSFLIRFLVSLIKLS